MDDATILVVSSITIPKRISFGAVEFGELDGTMLNAFLGWRRKASIMMLVVSLLFLAAWGRSRIRSTGFQMPLGRNFHLSVQSEHEDLVFRRFQTLKFPSRYPPSPGQEPTIFKYPVELECLFVPYFCLIVPLTISSAFLLFFSFPHSSSSAEGRRASYRHVVRFRWMNRGFLFSILASTVALIDIVVIINRNGWLDPKVTVELEGPFNVSYDGNEFRFPRKNNAYFDLPSVSVSIPPRWIPSQKIRAHIEADFLPKGAIKADRKFRFRIVVWDTNDEVMCDHCEEVEDGRAQILAGPRMMLHLEGLPSSMSAGELLLPLEDLHSISRIRIELSPG